MIRLLFTSGRGPAECRIAVAKTVPALMAEAASFGLEADCESAVRATHIASGLSVVVRDERSQHRNKNAGQPGDLLKLKCGVALDPGFG